MKISKYDITEFYYEYDSFEKDTKIKNILFDIISEIDVYLFEFNPIKDMTLIEDYSSSYEYKKDYNRNRYLYTTKPLKLTKEILSEIVVDASFQLGRLAIVLSDLSEEAALSLIISWKDERPLAGLKMIRLDYDGLCLLFYNMKENKKLQSIIANHNK